MKVEEGKYYRDADGNKRGPMVRITGIIVLFCEKLSNRAHYPLWYEDGSNRVSSFSPRAPDLVAEWNEDEATTIEAAGIHVLPPESDLVITDAFTAYFQRQVAWSLNTFGPAPRTNGILAHIRKELDEVTKAPHDLMEWIDIMILAMDGYHRHGGDPTKLMDLLLAKQQKNFARNWPDWRTMSEDSAIEHDRSGE